MTYRTSELLPVEDALHSLYDDASSKHNERCVMYMGPSQKVMFGRKDGSECLFFPYAGLHYVPTNALKAFVLSFNVA